MQDFGVPIVFDTGTVPDTGVGQSGEDIVLDSGGHLPGFREIQRFCVDFITDYAASAAPVQRH